MGLFRRSPKNRLKKALAGYELPSFPTVVTETLGAMRQPGSSAASIAQKIAADPRLSVRILQIANSAAFSPVRQVDNLSQAIALVGLVQVEGLLLAAGVRDRLASVQAPGLDLVEFWRLSARRAVVARELARMLCPAHVCACFTAGFLQDMAIPLLAHQRAETYGPFLRSWRGAGSDLVAFEQEAFGWDHAQVAGWMGEQWQMPERIVHDIRTHHYSGQGEDPASIPVRLATEIQADEGGGLDTLLDVAQQRFGLPADAVYQRLNDSQESIAEISRLLA